MPVLSEFNPPWFEGIAMALPSEVPATWPVAIAGHGYLIEPELYQRTFVPVQRDPQDTSDEPGEQSLNPGALWRRSQSDWSLGAGQLWLDEKGSTRQRFRQSLGIDVFTEMQVSLLPETAEKRDTANTNLRILQVGARLYVVDGATLIFSNGSGSEQNSTWTTGWTTATGLPGGAILDIATTGAHVYVLGSDNSIYRATPGTTAFTLWHNGAATITRIWVGLGRLFAAAANVLYEVSNVPAETAIFTHPFLDFTFTALVGTPEGVFFAGNVGQHSEIRNMVVNAAGSGWDAAVTAAELRNESIYALAAVGLNLLIGTSQGFRYSPIAGDSAGLDYGPVVSDVGEVREFVVDNVAAETFVWFTWSNIISSENGCGRIRLARFAEPKVPAYASDIYTTASGTSLTVASISGRRYFGVSGQGFYGATVNSVASGTLSTGRIRYGMLDTKVFVDLIWRTAPLPTDARVSATFIADTGEVSSVTAQTATSSTTSPLTNLGPVFAEWGELTFLLERGGVAYNGLILPGGASDNATTPDHASFDTDDINIRMHLAPSTWTPAGLGKFLIDQWPNVAGNNAWAMALTFDGKLQLSWSTDGTAVTSEATTNALGFLAGSEHWVGVSLDADNGAAGHRVIFETSEDGVTWTTIEDRTVAGVTSIFNSTASMAVDRTLVFDGYVVSVSIRNGPTPGVGTVIANPDFNQPTGTTSFADTAAVPKTWTVNGAASIGVVAGSDAEAPILRAWVLRSIPSPQVTQRFLVPVKLQHKLQPPWGPIRGVHSDAELEFLAQLVANQSIVAYQEGRASFDVHVLNFDVRGVKWDKAAQHMETLVVIEMLSI